MLKDDGYGVIVVGAWCAKCSPCYDQTGKLSNQVGSVTRTYKF